MARIVSAASVGQNGFLWLLLNSLFPWDFYTAYRLEQAKKALAEQMPAWLDTYYQLEALSSFATFAYLNPESSSFPELCNDPKSQPLLLVTDLGHPLLNAGKRVTNDLTIGKTGQLLLITGSNMSGKSTLSTHFGAKFSIGICRQSSDGTTVRRPHLSPLHCYQRYRFRHRWHLLLLCRSKTT